VHAQVSKREEKKGKAKDKGFHQPFAELEKIEKIKKALPTPAPAAPAPALIKKTTIDRSRLSDDDLFLAEMSGTERMDRKVGRVGAPPADPAKQSSRPTDDAEVLAQLADLCDGGGPFDIADSDEYIEGIGEGIDRRLLKRLRAGEYSVQAHVDLHGATREEARERVARFLAESRRAGRRCVLVVHGRGMHSKDQIPVLKQAVKSWLERGQIARMVLAFTSARPSDGGAGAVYVLLRR
jgi:DNA-nicking Smr family endonuclease